MSEEPKDPADALESHNIEPDYFSYCTREAALLLSQDDDLVPFESQTSELSRADGVLKEEDVKKVNTFPGCGHLFSNSIGSGLSDLRRERLNVMLSQGVVSLSQEVDEIMDPVVKFHRIRSHVERKRQQSSESNLISNGEKVGTFLCSCMRPEEEHKQANADLRFLLENDDSNVMETMKNYSAELSTTLKHMERQLEELLDTVISKCSGIETQSAGSEERPPLAQHPPMTFKEQQEVRNMIERLPPRNMGRVVEIIRHCKPGCDDEIHVDLSKVDNATLWRLYYYIKAVGSARKRSADVREDGLP